MKRKIISITILLIFFVIAITIFSFRENIVKIVGNVGKQEELPEEIVLQGEYNENTKQVHLTWNIENSENYLYKCYQKRDDAVTYQTISTTTFDEGEYIKVLNVYPNAGNNLAGWMNNYGMGIIKVDQVTITNFNSNPNGYMKDGSGVWKYDVLVFGFWDSNNGYDLNATSRDVTKQFIEDGKGCIFGHDTIRYDFTNFNSLRGYVNLTTRPNWNNNSSTDVYLTKKGVFTSYPWDIGEVGTHLTIPTAHTLGQTANGDIWLKFNNNIEVGNNNFYLTTWNNCAMIQTGHSSGAATADEQKILANLIFYTNQLTSVTELKDYTIVDSNAPKNIEGLNQTGMDEDTISISCNASEDVPTIYDYYIEGTAKLANLNDVKSNTITLDVQSGLAGYSYLVDNDQAGTNVDNIVDTQNTEIKVNKSGYNWSYPVYFHIAAIDKAGNKSEVSTIELNAEDPLIFNYKNNGKTIIKAISSKPIKLIEYPDVDTLENIIVNVYGRNSISIDYNPIEEKVIDVTLQLEDGTLKTKTLTIPRTE